MVGGEARHPLEHEGHGRRLAPVVTNERIDAMIAAAMRRGALAAKACGAGGGGCLAVLGGAEAGMAFRLDPAGLIVEGSCELRDARCEPEDAPDRSCS